MKNRKETELDSLAILGIRQHATASFPDECCGILFGYKGHAGELRISDAVPLENKVDEGKTDRYFKVDPMSVWRLERAGLKRGLEVVGIYHSHPGAPAELSLEDEDRMIPGQIYAVISISNGKCRDIRLWKKNDFENKPAEVVY